VAWREIELLPVEGAVSVEGAVPMVETHRSNGASTTGRAFYNEFDAYPAAWLRNLIAAEHLPVGTVDERSISDLTPSDLYGFDQCHFFAGIGGWPLALRYAGVPDDFPLWTGSCPCQPFSAAGKRGGHADERHLWPAWFRLIRERRPATIFGEQVASAAGLAWFDAVRADLEAEGYAVAAADLCAASVGAPHIRQRLFFVAYDHSAGRLEFGASRLHADGPSGHDADGRGESRLVAHAERGQSGDRGIQRGGEHGLVAQDGGAGGLADAQCDPRDARRAPVGPGSSDAAESRGPHAELGRCGDARLVGDAEQSRLEGHAGDGRDGDESRRLGAIANGPVTAPSSSFWSAADWLPCRDGKARPVEPGTFPLAHGVSGRVGRLRAYGNAIVPQVAAEFIRAALGVSA
jgi:DNA (cytosine-5)-methyltransferase 1